MTSTRASKAFSSRLWASTGPLTAAITAYPPYENVAEPSDLARREISAVGSAKGAIVSSCFGVETTRLGLSCKAGKFSYGGPLSFNPAL